MSRNSESITAQNEWEIVIGMEVHAQVSSNSKLFSGAATDFGADPNSQVSYVDAAFPGMLPVINGYCVEQAIKTGLGLNAKINLYSLFDRKNYFYADLPAGYQISQYLYPIVGAGHLNVTLSDGTIKTVGITRLHLEQDAGKSFHDQHPTKSYIDLNRAGVALMEIVSEPDMRSAEEAAAYLRTLRQILRYLKTCDGNMDEGSMRADVNVSVRRKGSNILGTRCEIKNVNSIKFVGQAIEYEARRQIEVIENGGEIDQETRLFDASTGTTRTMRSKENAHDYRYFPDPDLPPLVIDPAVVERIKAQVPELPEAKQARYQRDYGLNAYDAALIAAELETAQYYEAAVAKVNEGNDKSAAKIIANWLIGEVFAALNRDELEIEQSKITAEQLARLIMLIVGGQISGKIAKDVFAEAWEKGHDPQEIVSKKNLRQISDEGAILAVIREVMNENISMVEQYRQGKTKLFSFFVGIIMKKSNGTLNPMMLNQLLQKELDRVND